MGATQTLQTMILINAKVGNGFGQVGSTIAELGMAVSGVSDKLIEFGKDSVNVYREYEASMKDAEVALSTTYGRNTRELSSVMSQLDASATEWAATTIFHTDDVANAISEAAHAGWDLDKIMSGVPAAMELAQAGGIDLSEAVNYIVKSANAAGIEFEDMGTFIDHWAFAANSSATTIDEMGAAMLKMGGTMKFAENTDELLTMLAILADTGYTGTEAGTLLRNAMMRLVAPTKKAKEAMAELGATSDETAALFEDEELAAANARLEAHGFSLFDEQGNMKSMLDTYRDLYVALGDIAGGYEDLERNEDVDAILSAIFPQRSTTGALALLEAASTGYKGLYEALQEGDAADYGEYAAETRMDSLDGKIETFESKVERLKQAVGEELAPQLESVLGSIGGLVDKVTGLDEGTFSAIVSGLEVIAAAGPGLVIAGGAIKLLGWALTPAGGITLGALALLTAAAAIERIEQVNFKDNFGDLELDSSEITAYVGEISAGFDDAYGKINAYREGLEKAVSAYSTASGELKSDLITKMLTGAELTEDDTEKLNSLGGDIINAVKDGIENNTAANLESVTQAFGGKAAAKDNPIWAQIVDVMNQGYEENLAKAEEMGQRLRDAMTSAFEDGHLNADEVSNIQSILDEQNELLAKQQEVDNYVERKRILRKGQTLGLNAVTQAVDLTKEQLDLERETMISDHDRAYKETEQWYDEAIEKGWMIQNTDGTAGEHRATELDKTIGLYQLRQGQEQQIKALTASGENFVLDTMLAGISESDLSGAWGALETFAASFREAGGIVTQTAQSAFNSAVGAQDESDIRKYLGMLMGNMGGYETVSGFADFFRGQGDAERAAQYQMLMDMYDILGNGSAQVGTIGGDTTYETLGTREQMAAILSGGSTALTPEGLAEYMHQSIDEWGMQPDWFNTLGEDLYYQMANSAMRAGYEGPDSDKITQWVSDLESQEVKMQVTPEISEEGATDVEDQTMNIIPQVDESELPSIDPIPVPIKPYTEGENAAESLLNQGVEVSVGGNTEQLEATIDGADGKNLLAYVDGDASNLSMKISDQDGKTLVENVTGNTASLAQAIAAYEGRTITVNIAGRQLFASGGRATTASIFGEAGPEWAIPEEHSERTAELLNQARAASGFSWQELLAMYGGLNAGGGNSPTTLVYSPTIQAADASGVEQVLLDDKKRLEKWWNDKQMRDEVEVYA